MIRFRLAELMADHQFKHGRRITVKDLSEATGINRNTLSRMANTRGYSTSTDTLDKLCRFFGCDVGDLARYIDEAPLASSMRSEESVELRAIDAHPVSSARVMDPASPAREQPAAASRKRGPKAG